MSPEPKDPRIALLSEDAYPLEDSVTKTENRTEDGSSSLRKPVRTEPSSEIESENTERKQGRFRGRTRTRTSVEKEADDAPIIVAAPRTKQGTPKAFNSFKLRERKAFIILFILLGFAAVGVLNTCQGLLSDDNLDGKFSDVFHTHAEEILWIDLAKNEAGKFISGRFDEMLSFPGQENLVETMKSADIPFSSPEAHRIVNQSWEKSQGIETHILLVEARTNMPSENDVTDFVRYRVTVRLSQIERREQSGQLLENISHLTTPYVEPVSTTPLLSSCEGASDVSLPSDATNALSLWIDAWLSNNAADLVRVAGITSADITYSGVGKQTGEKFALLSIISQFTPCGLEIGDTPADEGVILTVVLQTVDCRTGKTAVLAQNLVVEAVDTVNPVIRYWDQIGVPPSDQSISTRDAPIGTSSECEGVNILRSEIDERQSASVIEADDRSDVSAQ